VTPRRYDAYRRVCTELDGLSSRALADGEKELLRDVAEGLLLARHGEQDEIDELRCKAAVALSLLAELGRWSDGAADEMWDHLVACGPLEGREPRPARVVQHA
jgi:hypothetical protein